MNIESRAFSDLSEAWEFLLKIQILLSNKTKQCLAQGKTRKSHEKESVTIIHLVNQIYVVVILRCHVSLTKDSDMTMFEVEL